jgi:hypothetical protein
VGKDTAADIVCDMAEVMDEESDLPYSTEYWTAHPYKFAEPLKDAVHALIGMPMIADDFFESKKDVPVEAMMLKTPRECYIGLSEAFAKHFFSQNFFGRVMVNRLKNDLCLGAENTMVTISDSGFVPELHEVLEASTPKDYFLLVRLVREGHDYVGDSRSYVTKQQLLDYHHKFGGQQEPKWEPRLVELEVENNGTIEEFRNELKKRVGEWASTIQKNSTQNSNGKLISSE